MGSDLGFISELLVGSDRNLSSPFIWLTCLIPSAFVVVVTIISLRD